MGLVAGGPFCVLWLFLPSGGGENFWLVCLFCNPCFCVVVCVWWCSYYAWCVWWCLCDSVPAQDLNMLWKQVQSGVCLWFLCSYDAMWLAKCSWFVSIKGHQYTLWMLVYDCLRNYPKACHSGGSVFPELWELQREHILGGWNHLRLSYLWSSDKAPTGGRMMTVLCKGSKCCILDPSRFGKVVWQGFFKNLTVL